MSNLPQIIAITGRMRNGKDTLANYLIEKYDYKQLSFAEPIKQISMILFSFTNEQCYGNEKDCIDERWKVTPRKVFQYIGTDLFRKQMKEILPNIEENFWVKVLQEKIKVELNKNKNSRFVISDMRFFNELTGLKKLAEELNISLMSIRVTRPSINQETIVHESESNINKIEVDYDILNDKTISDLYDYFEKNILSKHN